MPGPGKPTGNDSNQKHQKPLPAIKVTESSSVRGHASKDQVRTSTQKGHGSGSRQQGFPSHAGTVSGQARSSRLPPLTSQHSLNPPGFNRDDRENSLWVPDTATSIKASLAAKTDEQAIADSLDVDVKMVRDMKERMVAENEIPREPAPTASWSLAPGENDDFGFNNEKWPPAR